MNSVVLIHKWILYNKSIGIQQQKNGFSQMKLSHLLLGFSSFIILKVSQLDTHTVNSNFISIDGENFVVKPNSTSYSYFRVKIQHRGRFYFLERPSAVQHRTKDKEHRTLDKDHWT